MSAKLVEQELHWFPLESRQQQFRHPSPCRESSIFHSLPVSTLPSRQERELPSDTSFPLRAKVPFQEGLFPPLCPLLLSDLPEVQHKQEMPWAVLAPCSLLQGQQG